MFAETDLSRDKFLCGRLQLWQPIKGYRAATATGVPGKPALWRQRRDGVDETVEGSADRIELDGQEVHVPDSATALGLGIAMIHQELAPVPAMTVAENIYLGREPVVDVSPFTADRFATGSLRGEVNIV